MKFEEIPDTPQNGFEDIAPLEKPEEEKPQRSYGGQALEDEEQFAASLYPGTTIPLGVVVARAHTRIETGDVPYEEMAFVDKVWTTVACLLSFGRKRVSRSYYRRSQ